MPAAPRRKDPVALQMVNAVNKLRIIMQNFQKGLNRAFRDLNDMLKGSDLFRKSNATTIMHFFKNAIPLLTKIKNAIRFVAKSFKGGGAAPAGGAGGVPPPAPPPAFAKPTITPEMLDDLAMSMRAATIGSLDLGDAIEDWQHSKIRIDPGELAAVHGEFQSLINDAAKILQKVTGTKKGSATIAKDFKVTNKNATQVLKVFRDVVRSGQFTANDFWDIEQRVGDIVFRLGLAQGRLSKAADAVDRAGRGYERVSGAIGTQVKDLLKIHGREFLLGSVEGVRSFIKHVAGLNDLIIDLRKTAQFDLPPEKWRKSIIDTANAYNKMAKPIYTLPTDIAEAFLAVAKTGIKSEQVVKDLGKTIYEMSKATNVSIDAAADLGHTMTTTWHMSSKEAQKFLSGLVQTSRTLNVPLDSLIERTKTLGDQFLLSFKAGEVEGEDRVKFLIGLSNSIGALNQAGRDSTKVLENMALALQATPEAATRFAPFLRNVYEIRDALTKGNLAGAFEMMLSDLSVLKNASNTSVDALNKFAEMSNISFGDLQDLLKKSDPILADFRRSNTQSLKDYSKNLNNLTTLAAEESSKLGNSFENWLKKFWTNIESRADGTVGRLVNTFYKFKDAIIPAYFALKLFGLGFEPIMKISGLVLTFLGQYIVGAVAATLHTGLFNGALAATSFGGFVKGLATAVMGLFGFGSAAGTATFSFTALAGAVWAATWPILAVVAAVTAVVLIWKNWNSIIGWFQKTFPGLTKVVGNVASSIMTWFSDMWTATKEVFTGMWMTIEPVVTSIGNLFRALWELFKADLEEVRVMLSVAASAVQGFFAKVWQYAKPVVDAITGFLKYTWDTLGLLGKMLGGVFGKVLGKVLGITDKSIRSLTKDVQKATAAHKTSTKELKKGQMQGASAIKGTTNNVQLLSTKVDSFTDKAEEMKNALTEAFDPKTRAFATYLDKAEKTFSSFFKRIGSKAKAIGYRVLGHFAPDVEAAIAQASKTYNVAPNLIRSVIMQESGGDPFAKSPVGARGLMQLMPGTAKDLGLNTLEDIYDVNKNVAAGTKYLGQLLKMYGGDINQALAAYNWGMGNVNKLLAGLKTDLPAETKDYIEKVTGYLAEYQKRYPPMQLADLMAIAPLMEPKTVTPEPTMKVAQPQSPVFIMPNKAMPQEDVVMAVNGTTKAVEDLTNVFKADAQREKKVAVLPPMTKQEDQLMTLIRQYQT